MYGGISMNIKPRITIVSPKTIARILSTPTRKYDAKRAVKEARKKMRKQGLWL